MKISGYMKTTLLDYPGLLSAVVFAGGCNLRCPFCHNSELLGEDVWEIMSEDELIEDLSKRAAKIEGVVFTGGEPTLYEDLPSIISKVREKTGLKIKLDTNGTNPSMVEKLINEGLLDYVAMDIKAAPSNYANACGVKISDEMFRNITRTKDMLIVGSTDYEFRTTVVGGIHFEGEFKELGEYIKGAGKYYLQAYMDSDSVLDKKRGFFTPEKEDLECFASIVAPYVGQVEIRGVE